MDIGKIKRIFEVDPEPFPLGHPENDPIEPNPLKQPVKEPVPV